tara:strand:- start:283 stop:627 length:345 start_codon:yes stop_codon:yes gene_type:complete
MEHYNLKLKNKELTIPVKKLTNIFSHTQGLMFQKNPSNLLFIFKKPKEIAIHSYFCKPFIAIWLLDNKIQDIKIVEPNTFSVKPKHKFNKLLEIPNNNKEFKEIYKILDDARNI